MHNAYILVSMHCVVVIACLAYRIQQTGLQEMLEISRVILHFNAVVA